MTLPLTLRAPAKLNLDLRVLAQRADGYHELRTIFQELALADTLTFARTRGPFRLEGPADVMPLDRTNLVWRAAEALWARAGRAGEPRGVRVTVRKRIPSQAGLGGGSSDAAATLLALNRFWRCGLDVAALHDLARGLGSDVPFFLVGGTALGLGRGEQLYPLPPLPARAVLLVRPPFGVSTAAAYGWARDDRRRRVDAGGGRLEVPWPPGVLDVRNDLEAPVVRRHPEIRAVRADIERAGADLAMMSGSGSAVFGLFRDLSAARAAARGLRRPGWLVEVTSFARSRPGARAGRPKLPLSGAIV